MALRTKVKALLAGGASAIVIAAAMLGGNHGLEGRRHEPYRDVAGVLTVCDGHKSLYGRAGLSLAREYTAGGLFPRA